MATMLRVENDFTPCPVATGDELFPNGIFVFNITKILEYIQKNPDSITLEEVAVSDFFEGFSSVNESSGTPMISCVSTSCAIGYEFF